MYLDNKKKEECCGCKACGVACPEKAILFNNDEEGFWYPEIDVEKCIKCNLCRKVCPIEAVNIGDIADTGNVYACYANDKEVLGRSSSGGVFSVISDVIIEHNGVVFGCRWSNDMRAEQASAVSRKERDCFCGSKYVQSDSGNTFIDVKRLLDKDKTVLYSGTPCQIFGLKCFLGNENKNLITVDLVCHGVPSPRIFKDYIETLEKTACSKVTNLRFRDKTYGWTNPAIMVEFANQGMNICALKRNGYNCLFLELDAIIRPSCYSCRFAGKVRISDFSIADFWGIEAEHPEMLNNNNGVSALLVNSEKAYELLNCISPNRITLKKVPLHSVQKANTPLNIPTKPYFDRKRVFKDYNRHGLGYCIKKYCSKNLVYRIGRKIRKTLYYTFNSGIV
jgi:coenzyme F420-reducing hydrogenase beta subunit